MKLKLNKKIATLIPLLCISIGGMLVFAKDVDTDKNEISVSAQKVRAVSTDTIKGGTKRLDYLNSSDGKLVYFRRKTSTNYGPAYCTNRLKSTPPTGGSAYKLVGEQSKKALYAMEYDTGFSDGDVEYYVKSMGVHYAWGDYVKVMTQSGVTENYKGVKASAQGLAKILDGGNFKTTQDVTTSLSSTSLSFTQNGSYYDSNWITLKINNPTGLDYSPILQKSVVNLSGAPSGTQVLNSSGTAVSGGDIGTSTSFKIRVPVSSVTGTISITASVSSTFEVGAAYLYNPTSGSYQPMCVRATKSITVNSPGASSGTIVGGGNLKVVKKGSDGKFLSGASFQVKNGNVAISEIQTTNSNGETIFNNLPAGVYTLVETAAPWGYVNAGSHSVTVSAGTTNTKTVINQRDKGNFKVIKKDDTGNPLEGAEFQLQLGTTVAAGPFTTNSNGEILFTNMPTGGYSLVEVSAPTGYLIDSAQNNKIVEVSSSTTNQIVITNKKIRGDIKVTKADSADGRIKLAGAEFKLYDSSGSHVSTAVTDSSGVATFNNIPYGTYKVQESKAPVGYFLNSTPVNMSITTNGQTVSTTIYDDRIRDFSMPSYNVKDTNGNIVGTLEKNKSYQFNVKIISKFLNLTLPSDAILTSPNIDKFKYVIAVNDGTINQDISSITTSNIKGTVITSGTKTNIPIKDLSTIWQTIDFKVPNDETYGEIVFVVEIEASKDGNSNNNRLVVKLPIINKREDKLLITNMEVYPATSGDAIVGNDVNVKLDLSTNTLKTYNANTKLKISGPSGFGTKTLSKPSYGVSMEQSGSVYYKFKPTVAGTYTITAEASIPSSTATSQSKSITVVHPSEPKTYLASTTRNKSVYDTNSYIKTYVKVEKRDKDKLHVWSHSTPCQEDTNGTKVCPGHESWVWNQWYDAFVPRKNTQMTGIEESYNITEIKFRSKLTENNAQKYPLYIDSNGYVNLLNANSAKYAQVKAGYGFDLLMKSEYSNNLPEVFNKAYAGNTAPGNTRWSEYKTKAYSGAKIPFVYADIYGDSKTVSVDSQVASYTGVVAVTVPSLSDLIIENPNQLYIKLPEPSKEYYMVNEGYGTRYNDTKIKQGLVMSNTTGVKLTSTKYSEVKQFEFEKNATNELDKRGYYISKEVTDGARVLSIYNRYVGYGLNKNTRLNDRKDVSVKVYGGRYDDIKD